MIKHRSGWPAWRSIAVLLALLHCGGTLATPKVYYVHTDHLGTPQVLSDKNQTVVWRAHYEPFGTATVDEDPDGDGASVVMPIRFPGQYFDSESGLHYNYFRDYDPTTGRYIQSDLVGLYGGINTYGYVSQNPIRYTDRMGFATDHEINTAINLMRNRFAEIFPKAPTSVQGESNLTGLRGNKVAARTDFSNFSGGQTITYDTGLYGENGQPVAADEAHNFLQTMAHEMQHVQESLLDRLVVGLPGLEGQIDRNADIIYRQLRDDFINSTQCQQ